MAAKFFALVSLAVAASALPVYPVAKVAYAEAEAPAHYEFQYSVQDAHSGDVKQQHEARAGDSLQGSYSLIQPDGVQRIVDYTADKENGFNAVVRYEGHPTEAPAKIAYAPAPVTYAAPKIAYAPAPITYAAPKIAYAPAPVTYAAPKIAYAPAPVTYAAPKIAYAPAPVTYAAPKIAYAPVAKVAYAAPVTKVAYSAPVAKLAYAAPLAQVSYSSPVISYQH